MGIDADEQVMGRLLHLPAGSAAGETVALRAAAVAVLREKRATAVDEMSEAVRRAGLGPVLELGGVALERRLDGASRIVLGAWAHGRPLHADDLDAVRALGVAAARAGLPLWRVLHAVQRAARAGWEYAADQAIAVVEESRRPRLAARVVGELSVEMMDVLGRIESQIAAGYGEVLAPIGGETLRG